MALMGEARLAVLDRKGRRPETSQGDMTGKSMLRPDQQQDVLLVTQDVELTERLRAGFAEKNHFAFRSVKGSATEIEGLQAGTTLPTIAIIDLKTAAPEDLAALERSKRTRFAATPVIAVKNGCANGDATPRVAKTAARWPWSAAFP